MAMVAPKGVFMAPNGNVIITSPSSMTGKEHSMELPMKPAEYRRAMAAYAQGALIQVAFPGLSASQREFLLTGITDEEWKALKEDPDEE